MAENRAGLPGSPPLSLSDLLGERRFSLTVLAGGEGTGREVVLPHLQKPGLILTGDLDHLNPEKIQILGLTEVAYLRGLEPETLRSIVDSLLSRGVVCFILTKDLQPPDYLLQAADKRRTPVLKTPEKTSTFIKKLTDFLEKRLAPRTALHGVLMSVQGVGVLILGKSGIGKSECALDLVYKGHRLVADDLVFLQRIGHDIIVGFGSQVIRHHMEIRGLGIIDIKDLFGVVSVTDSARVELVIELLDWSEAAGLDRLGLEETTQAILEVDLPLVRLPVSPGRNLSVILEVAVRNHLLKKSGYHAPRNVEATMSGLLAAAEGVSDRERRR